MTEPTIRISMPATAKAGERILIKTLISHPMETGRRRDGEGKLVPQDILRTFRCSFEGEQVVGWEMSTGVAANPYVEFEVIALRSGRFAFVWEDEDGAVHSREQVIEVTA